MYLGAIIAQCMSLSRYGKASLWRLSALHSARYHVRMLQVLDSDTLFNLFIQNKDKRMMGS